ncbi:MAG: ABC1 kinase family protein, partial [Polyangiales bacterium]
NRRFAHNFADVEGVDVPALYDELCTRRVLTMELVEGVRATEPEKVGGDPKKLALRGLDAILRMVFQHGFVHADLHPGNIILTRDDRVVLIDLGLVAEIPDDMKRPWVETFMALASQDGAAAARLFYVYAPRVGTKDYAAYERDVVAYFQEIAGKTLGEVETSAVIGGVMAILRRHQVQIDPVFTVVNIAMLVAEGLGKQLDPSLDVVQLAVPYLTEAMATAPTGRGPRREVAPAGGSGGSAEGQPSLG